MVNVIIYATFLLAKRHGTGFQIYMRINEKNYMEDFRGNFPVNTNAGNCQ